MQRFDQITPFFGGDMNSVTGGSQIILPFFTVSSHIHGLLVRLEVVPRADSMGRSRPPMNCFPARGSAAYRKQAWYGGSQRIIFWAVRCTPPPGVLWIPHFHFPSVKFLFKGALA